MKPIIFAMIFVVLTSCGSTENTRSSSKSSNAVVAKLFGGDLPADEEWYIWDTCGQPNGFSNGRVYVENNEIFIDFNHHRRSIAFDGTYDRFTGLVEVSGSDRSGNGRIGKEPRAGVFLPETNTLVLFKTKNSNPNSQCEIILSLDDDVIDAIDDGETVLPAVFKKRLGKTKKQIYAACENGKTAQWVKRFWDKSGRISDVAVNDVFAPSEFWATFNTPYSKDAHEYILKSITDDGFCGLEETFSRGEVIKNARKTQQLLAIGNEGMKRRLVSNFITTQHDLWLLRVNQYLISQNQQKPSLKLDNVNNAAEASKRFKKYSKLPHDELTITIANKRNEYASLIINDKLDHYKNTLQLNLKDIDDLSKMRKKERQLFSYLVAQSSNAIEGDITLIVNQHAKKELRNYLTNINTAQNIDALVDIEAKYREVFSYLDDDISLDVLSLRADFVYDFIDKEFSFLDRQESVTLNNIVTIAHYDINNARQWNTLYDTHRVKLNNKRSQVLSKYAPNLLRSELEKAIVEKIYAFHEFYYSKATQVLAFMKPQDQRELKTAFRNQLDNHCDLDMALTATILLKARGIIDHAIALDKTNGKVNFKDEEEAFCYARLLVNNYETIVHEQSHFISEARARFDNSVKFCSVLADEDISFLKENNYDLPLYEKTLGKLKKSANAAQRGINGLALGLSNAQCKQRYPYLPFRY
jgi:hypothetical protein